MCSLPQRSAGDPPIILPIVDPARETDDMITNPNPSFSCRVTVTS